MTYDREFTEVEPDTEWTEEEYKLVIHLMESLRKVLVKETESRPETIPGFLIIEALIATACSIAMDLAAPGVTKEKIRPDLHARLDILLDCVVRLQ